MPLEKIRLRGSSSRVVTLATDSPAKTLTIVFAEGEDLPAGDLYATATGKGDTVTITPYDITGSDGIVTVEVTLDPEDFAAYGTRGWKFEVGTLVDGSGDDDTAYVLFAGSIAFREDVPNVIASTTVEEAGSS
jgi:ribosomal protein L27